jgi:hypothetical protein
VGISVAENERRHFMVFFCIAGTYIKRILVRLKSILMAQLCGLQSFYDRRCTARLGLIGFVGMVLSILR